MAGSQSDTQGVWGNMAQTVHLEGGSSADPAGTWIGEYLLLARFLVSVVLVLDIHFPVGLQLPGLLDDLIAKLFVALDGDEAIA